MKTINRSVLIVVPKQPFIDWALQTFEGEEPPDPAAVTWDCTAYLVDEIDDDSQETSRLKKVYEKIFTEELSSWIIDKRHWPEKRDFKTFREWFEIQTHSIVIDMGRRPLGYD